MHGELQSLPLCLSDASMYAHYLFNAFDTAQNGSVKFEVTALPLLSMPFPQFCVLAFSVQSSWQSNRTCWIKGRRFQTKVSRCFQIRFTLVYAGAVPCQ